MICRYMVCRDTRCAIARLATGAGGVIEVPLCAPHLRMLQGALAAGVYAGHTPDGAIYAGDFDELLGRRR